MRQLGFFVRNEIEFVDPPTKTVHLFICCCVFFFSFLVVVLGAFF